MRRYVVFGQVMLMVLLLGQITGCTPKPKLTGARVELGYEEKLGYSLYVNGEPFPVRGASGYGHWETLRGAGANTIRIYEPDSLPMALDSALSHGLMVVADIPLPKYLEDSPYYNDPELLDSLDREVAATVSRHHGHPALLFWILGNEIDYLPGDAQFRKRYGRLVDTVRKLDRQHPVSTTMVSRSLISVARHEGLVDFPCINIFGTITEFESNIGWLSVLWEGPYLISEWGGNGPWESETTHWRAPYEQPSATKARILRERYQRSLQPLERSGRCLGHLAFYWGAKRERTATWFSLFSPTGDQSEMVTVLGEIWTGAKAPYTGPQIDYLLLEELGQNVLLPQGEQVRGTARYSGESDPTQYDFEWTLSREDWYAKWPDSLLTADLSEYAGEASARAFTFTTPRTPGPYRLQLNVRDDRGRFATANIPFYVNGLDAK